MGLWQNFVLVQILAGAGVDIEQAYRCRSCLGLVYPLEKSIYWGLSRGFVGILDFALGFGWDIGFGLGFRWYIGFGLGFFAWYFEVGLCFGGSIGLALVFVGISG